jgi:DNA-binding MarR family transcriptional regulator
MEKLSPWGLWTLNFELSMAVLAEVEPDVREQGLEMKELFLLGKLDEHPYPADLARALLTPKPSITFMVKRMEAAGFIQRQTEAGDLRRCRLTLTRSGRKAMEAARAILEEAFGRRLARLSAAERAELVRLLGRLAEGRPTCALRGPAWGRRGAAPRSPQPPRVAGRPLTRAADRAATTCPTA